MLCAAVALLVVIASIGCGGSSSSETTSGPMYSTGTKLGERGPTASDPVELSGPLAEELEDYLIENYEGEPWFPALEDVWSRYGTVIVSGDLDRSAKSKKIAEEVCSVVRKAPVKHQAKTITVNYAYQSSVEC
jgi:hypothetical protein